MSVYLGIDPGGGGGIAVLRANGTVQAVQKMPATERDLLDLFLAYPPIPDGFGQTEMPGAKAVLERVSSSPQMGVVSAFTFGQGVGRLKMALTAAKIPFEEVTPQKWQKAMGVIYPEKKVKQGTRDKNIAKRRAQHLFPFQKITHATADALLLAEYCRRIDLAGRIATFEEA